MSFPEGLTKRKIKQTECKYNPDDYQGESFYPLLKKIPTEIAGKCLNVIESNKMEDDEAGKYLKEIIERRHEVTTESKVSDIYVKQFFEGQEQKIYHDIETKVFSDSTNHLGAGMTARIKRYNLQKNDDTLPVAIKYVVTPTSQTLSASGEHDVLLEVERIERIEKIELQHSQRSKYIRVPHPYFHHHTDKIYCYGMELIEGTDLKEIINDTLHPSIKDILKESPLIKMNQDELLGYITRFFNTMHEYCLHGDIKPANIMLSTDGVLYVIDFGQSILVNTVTEETADQFDVLKEDEIKGAQQSVVQALNTLRE